MTYLILILALAASVRAQSMLDHIIAYLRATLDASRSTTHTLQAEFDRLQDYLELMSIRMGPRLAFSLQLPPELASRVRFEVGDASRLPFEDGAFELVTLANMIPFFDELARVTAAGGAIVFSFSKGSETPIYVATERLRRELGRRGFSQFADFAANPTTALVARKG